MGEHRLAGEIADRPDVAHRRRAALVDLHEAAVQGEVEALEAKTFQPGAPTGGDEDLVGGDAARARPFEREAIVGKSGGARARQNVDAQRLQAARHRPHQLGVVDRQDAVQRLDHRDLRAELGIGHAELEPDIARTDDGQPLGHLGKRQRLGRGDDLAAERQVGQRRRHRAGRQHDMLGAHDLRAGVGLDAAGLAVDHLGPALQDLYPVALQEHADAAGQAADDAVLPFDGARQVDGRTLDPDAERCRSRLLDGVLEGVGGVDQRLGRDAADIEAGAAQPAFPFRPARPAPCRGRAGRRGSP